jgi:hypothetical protein
LVALANIGWPPMDIYPYEDLGVVLGTESWLWAQNEPKHSQYIHVQELASDRCLGRKDLTYSHASPCIAILPSFSASRWPMNEGRLCPYVEKTLTHVQDGSTTATLNALATADHFPNHIPVKACRRSIYSLRFHTILNTSNSSDSSSITFPILDHVTSSVS